MFDSKYCVPNVSLSVATLPECTQLLLESGSFALDKVEKFVNSRLNLLLDQMASAHVSEKPALLLLHIFFLPFAPYNLPS